MTAISIDPRLWTRLHPLLIAHDVGGSRDRSTAVVGRSHLLEALHSNLQAGQVCLAMDQRRGTLMPNWKPLSRRCARAG